MGELQIFASMSLSALGFGLLIIAYMEANDLEFDLEEIEDEETQDL